MGEGTEPPSCGADRGGGKPTVQEELKRWPRGKTPWDCPEHRQRILQAYAARRDVPHFARLVDNGEIARNGYNIAVSSYVEQRDTREAVDIRALNAEIARIVARQGELRAQIDALVADLEGDQA